MILEPDGRLGIRVTSFENRDTKNKAPEVHPVL
jgi:hypothetical protein